jgi:NADH-quinone oxidoreductase subunit G
MTVDTNKQSAEVQPVLAEDLVTLTIDDVEVSVPKGTLVIRAAERIGTEIPRFCDHPLLAPAGACRQCLVDVADAGNGRPIPKPQASCTLEVADGMVIRTQVTSPVADKAQHGIMEFLLINHPLDCPVCDKGGECPLQNQSMTHGQGETRYEFAKRTYPKPISISAQVLLDRERCVLCARCTRFSAQIAGDPFIDMLERGALQQVGIYEQEPFESYFSGNTIQICPVGALTSAAYRFRSRPFDLVSTPSIGEHDACGAAIRVDHRRGTVMRRLSGNDPEVNEEWISDKDRFAFGYATQDDRLTHPLIRDEESGELRTASWPEALTVAARGLAEASSVGVLTGGRLTVEDAYAYSKFARVVLGTNDIDFRSRPHTVEEEAFLGAHVAGTGLGVTYRDLEAADSVLLVAFEPEDEAGNVFLRLRKASLHGTRVFSIAPFTSRGLAKMSGTLIPAAPGHETAALATAGETAGLGPSSVILVGERAAESPGALAAAASLAASSGARLAWVPRRAGDRGALEMGCLPSLLPGGRPVSDAAARVDMAAVWSADSLPERPGLDARGILAEAVDGSIGALVIGGVGFEDFEDPAGALVAVGDAGFVVSLEQRETEITRRADVVFPVAPVSDRSGSFVNWEGRRREFGRVFHDRPTLPDLRVLAGIALEMGRPLGFSTSEAARRELDEVGEWDGARVVAPSTSDAVGATPSGALLLATWKQLIDDGAMQDGDDAYRSTARRRVALVSASTLSSLGLSEGQTARLSTSAGAVTLPVAVGDVVDGVVWTPTNSAGVNVRRDLAIGAGGAVTLEGEM